jgi:hypothetical protein
MKHLALLFLLFYLAAIADGHKKGHSKGHTIQSMKKKRKEPLRFPARLSVGIMANGRCVKMSFFHLVVLSGCGPHETTAMARAAL